MYSSTIVKALISKSDLILSHILLDFWQRKYAYCLLNFLNFIPIKAIFLIILQIGDKHVQPKDQSKDDRIWATHQKFKNYGQHLACQVIVEFCVDLANRVLPVRNLKHEGFLGKISIQRPKAAVLDAQKNKSDLVLWLDKSQLESRKISAIVVWKNAPTNC